MHDDHPDDQILGRFQAGELSEQEGCQIGWHLYRCQRCRKQLERTESGRSLLTVLFAETSPEQAPTEESYDDVISRTCSFLVTAEVELERDRDRAPGLYKELMQHPAARQQVLVANTRRFQSWGLIEHLLMLCSKAWFRNPAEAEGLAELALSVAETLPAANYSDQLIGDLQARCWMHLANSRRVNSKLREAEEAFEEAQGRLEQGTGDPMERIHLQLFKASLLRDQRLFSEAESILRRAVNTCQRIGESHLAGKAMMNLSIVYQTRGEPERAIEILARAVDLLDPEREPLVHLGSRHNLIDYLADAGRYMEARSQLVQARTLYEQYADAPLRCRWLWVQGKIASGLGQFTQAESLLAKVREDYLEQDLGYDAALVSLELAMVFARQGRAAEMKKLAEEMLVVFQALNIQREALAAVLLFREAAEAERVTLALLQDIANKIRKSRDAAPSMMLG